jgi:thiamine biosynthesis lipoprotein
MGCDVVVSGAGSRELGAVRRLFEQADHRFSRFRADSELNRVNAAAGRVTTVSSAFAETLELALWAAQETDGFVDPTLGGAIEAAGYDRDFVELPADGPAPGPGQPGAWQRIELHGRALSIPAGMRLDLNGVVKSNTVDHALAVLAGDGWVSAGGDVAARGALDVALPGGGAVRLEAGGLATSGTAHRYWRRGGVLYHHLIDPATGAPAAPAWEQVTVAGASCLDADVAAKAAFLRGEAGPGWLDERGLPGRFIRTDGSLVVNRSWREALDRSPACT